MAAPKVKPFRGRLYVKVYEFDQESTTEAGIVISARARQSEVEAGFRARIIEVGKECDPEFSPGVWILIGRYSGTVVTNERAGFEDLSYIIIDQDCVIGILDEQETVRALGLDSTAIN